MKSLLTTTAVVALVLGAPGAFAQDVQVDPNAPAVNQTMTDPAAGELFLVTPVAGSHLASNIIGMTVYTGNQQDAESIGDINDLIVADDGSIDAAIVGVGGFLGVGEKNVAVDFDQLAWVASPDANDPSARLVLATTADQLQQAPSFDVSVFDADASMASSTAAPAPGVDPNAANPDGMTTAQTLPAPAEPGVVGSGNYTDVDVATISANELMNATVYSAQNEDVGSVGDVILAEDGMIDAVVLDIGGFLGLGQKPVAISFEALTVRRDENGSLFVFTNFSREQLEQAPDYNADRYLMERETMRLGNS